MADVRRLLNEIVPSRYELALDLNEETFVFELHETIEFELKERSGVLTFHSLDLEVTSAKLDSKLTAKVTYDRDEHIVKFAFLDDVAPGSHTLKLTATGPIQDSLHGFYRSKYGMGEYEGMFYMTQFEAIHAREAFVCVDEPSAKAVFEISLTMSDTGFTALSNTPERSDVVRNGRRTVRFEPTPKMSTYLLAWVVSKLAYVEGKAKSGTMVRIFATPQYAKQLDYSLDFARRSLDFYEDYFAIPYPLPKLDLVACPNFASGAMENWGLVTYRETDLLVDAANTSLGQKQRIAEVITHELAHQWFGNLVTMSWWEDLWLNESFASWAETMTVDALEPDWLWWANYTASLSAYAREIDSLANTHPILVEVPDPKGLDEVFDAISYFKGQGLLRMLEGYLGAEVMRDGLRLYLNRHAYGNTVTDDLWAALSEASGKDVAGLMHAWTTLPGFPILSYEDGLVKQERFVASPREAKKLAEAGQPAGVWPVPFAAVLAGGQRSQEAVLDQAQSELPDEIVSAEWFKPNPEEQSFVRSVYTEGLVAALRQPLKDKVLGVADRFGVVNDVWAATGAGRTSSKAALDLTVALRDESDYYAALAVYDGFGSLLGIVEDDTVRARLEAVGQWLAEPNYQRLGWDVRSGESHFDTLLRPVALMSAIRFEVPGVQDEALKRFADYAGGAALDPNIRSAVLFGAARFGAVKEYEQLLELYRKEEAPHTRQPQLVTLGRFKHPGLAERTLKLAMSDEVRLQDVVYGLAGVWRARDNRDIAWKFLQDNWDELVDRFGEGGHMLDRFPGFPGDAYATHAKAAEVKSFFEAHPHVLITRPTAQAVETIEMKADWYDRDQADIRRFLDEWEAGPGATRK